jgi:hypothetical protein
MTVASIRETCPRLDLALERLQGPGSTHGVDTGDRRGLRPVGRRGRRDTVTPMSQSVRECHLGCVRQSERTQPVYRLKMARIAALSVLTMALVAACGLTQLSPSTVPLPTVRFQSNKCFGIGGGFVILRGDPNDARLTWETGLDGSGRQDIVWPPGYRARFAPGLEVLDPSGRVVARDGDRVPAGGCVAGPPDDPTKVVLVQSEDWPR